MNQKHSEISSRTLANMLPLLFSCFNRFYAFLKDFEIFNPSRHSVSRYFVTRYSLLVTRYSLLVTRYSLLVTRYSLLVTRYPLPVTRYSLLRYSVK